MLFSRIYNWVKYKTLPPSFLFTNRLFVERDSKHRRVVSNFGLTFRNSKWSSYSRVNVNNPNRTSYVKLLAYIILFITILTIAGGYKTYYDSTLLPNPVYVFLWFLFDADIYLKTSFISSFFCCLQLFSYSVQEHFFSTSRQTLNNESTKLLPKRLHKALLYQYFTATPNSNHLESLLPAYKKSEHSQSLVGLTQDLYKIVNLLNQTNSSYLTINNRLRQLANKNTDLSNYLNIRSSITSLELDYLLFNKPLTNRNNVINELTHWTLESLSTESKYHNFELKTKTGLFYFPELNQSTLQSLLFENSELCGLRSSIDQQLSTIRQQRWLYRYNILHRSSIHNSHNLTITKKLINSGFFNSSLLTRNIWAASNLTNLDSSQNSKQLDSGLIKSIYSSTYGNYLLPNHSNTDSLTNSPVVYNSPNLTSLNFYETSYHWFLKRFYQLNSLNTEKFALKPSVQTNSVLDKKQSINTLVNSTSLFDITSSSSLTLQPTVAESTSTSKPNYLLHYMDYTALNKSNTEQLLNLGKSKAGMGIYFYSPSKL